MAKELSVKFPLLNLFLAGGVTALLALAIVLAPGGGARLISGLASESNPADLPPCTAEAIAVEALPTAFIADEGFSTDATSHSDYSRTLPDQPASPELTQELRHVVEQVFSCQNEGELLRSYSLLSDKLLSRLSITDPTVLANPTPLPDDQRTALLDLNYVREFADGRAGAIVVFDGASNPEPIEVQFMVFSQADGHWKIDELWGTL